MKCIVCDINEKKYKCPKCEIQYCSVPCYKTHKNNCVPIKKEKEEEVKKETKEYDFPTEDIVPIEKLKLLDSETSIKEKILKYPYLRDILKTIDQAENPGEMLEKAMHDPIFVEFVDKCIETVN